MNREPSFPCDWIAPGEFRFCNCGLRLIPHDENLCGKCKQRGSANCSDEAHDRLSSERIALAEVRRSHGIQPLFWIGFANDSL